MKVLFHCWEFPPRGSGIGAYIFQMGRALAAEGHSAVIVTSRGDGLPDEEQTPAGRVYRAYHVEDIGSAAVVDKVLAIARSEQVDFIEGADHLGESAGVLRARNRPPVIIKCHYNDVLYRLRYAQAFYPWQKLLIDVACFRKRSQIADERFSIEHSDGLITPSRIMLDEIREQGLKVPAKTAVIPNPFPIPESYENQEADKPVVLFVGRIDIGKGIQYLPRMLSILTSKHPDLQLEIAGEDGYARLIGSMKEWLLRQSGAITSNIRFLGKLNRDGIDSAYRRAWVVIVPSRWDTFPTVVLESMARGKAIVASPEGGMPEMLEGTQCPIRDPAIEGFSRAVLEFLDNKSLRKRAGSSAREKVLKVYDLAIVVRQYINFVRSIQS